MKKLLMLGAALQQVPAIKRAKELGYHVITTDYLPDNPGHALADEHYDVSTTDKGAVLSLARNLGVDGIVAYASDPAAPTAAYVSEKLGLPGNSTYAVDILTQKDKFRAFLSEHGFKTPVARGYVDYEALTKDLEIFHFPVMVKPVDSCGSKGVVKVSTPDCLRDSFDEAMSYSRTGRVVVEDFIVKKGYQISGDGFSIGGKLVFTSYGNELYSGFGGMRDYVALGEFWPSLFPEEVLGKVDSELQRLISCLGMGTSAYNIEVIIDENNDVYIIELGPRNGGSYIPQLIEYATGVDLVTPTILAAAGDLGGYSLTRMPTKGFWSNYMILSRESGRFREITFDEKFRRNNLVDVFCTKKPGDSVEAYSNTSHSLGTLIFKASSLEEMLSLSSHMERVYKVVVCDN